MRSFYTLMIASKDAERYLAEVKKLMGHPRKMRKELLLRLRRDIADYSRCGGEMTYEALVAQFGEPEAYACDYVRDMDPVEVAHKMEFAGFVKRAVLISAVLAILIAVVLVVSISIKNAQPLTPLVDAVIYQTGGVG